MPRETPSAICTVCTEAMHLQARLTFGTTLADCKVQHAIAIALSGGIDVIILTHCCTRVSLMMITAASPQCLFQFCKHVLY